ncbi:MAG TPA: hypothetical protein VGC21_12120 [Telluria sp.]
MHQQDRTNTEMALIVEQGLARDREHGSVVAWKFLAAHQVPDAVILRVLTEPVMRRGVDTTSVDAPPRAGPDPERE